MCNLYDVTSNQEAIRDWARVMNDSTGNLPPMSGVFPDYAAPIVRNQPEGRELALVRWGMPTPPKYLVGKKTAVSWRMNTKRMADIVSACRR